MIPSKPLRFTKIDRPANPITGRRQYPTVWGGSFLTFFLEFFLGFFWVFPGCFFGEVTFFLGGEGYHLLGINNNHGVKY